MDWITVDKDRVLGALSANERQLYEGWIVQYPAKATRGGLGGMGGLGGFPERMVRLQRVRCTILLRRCSDRERSGVA